MDLVHSSQTIDRILTPLQTSTDMYQMTMLGVVMTVVVSTIIILACAMACAKWSREHPLNPEKPQQEGIFIDGSQDPLFSDSDEYAGSASPQRVFIPPRCPSCGISLSHDDIKWTGPLQGKCPSCDTTIRASVDTN